MSKYATYTLSVSLCVFFFPLKNVTYIFLCHFIGSVTSLVECYEMVLAIIMSVPENVWDECYSTCSSYLHMCYLGY